MRSVMILMTVILILNNEMSQHLKVIHDLMNQYFINDQS